MTKRTKKKFEGQQMVMLLGALAHNVMVWARQWLSKTNPRLVKFGVLRLVRDILTTSGFVELTAEGRLISLTLNRDAPAAKRCRDALSDLLKAQAQHRGQSYLMFIQRIRTFLVTDYRTRNVFLRAW